MATTLKDRNKAVAYTQMVAGQPSIFVTGSIYDGFGLYLGQYVYDAFTAHGTVALFVNSPGGLLTEAFAFMDFVQAKGVKFTVEAYGVIGSAATLIAAAAGRENVTIGDNAEWFMHRVSYQDSYGNTVQADPEQQDKDNARLVNAYMVLTGQDQQTVEGLLDKGDQGISLTAAEAVALGFAHGIIPASKAAAFKSINASAEAQAPSTMAKTNTAKVTVKLNLAQALSAVTGDGTELDINVDEQVATQLADKDAEIATLKDQIKTLEDARPAEGAVDPVAEANAEVERMKAENATHVAAIAERDKQIVALNAKLEAPLVKPTVASNEAPAVGAAPGTAQPNEGAAFVGQVFAQMNPMEKAAHAARVKRLKAEKAAKG